MDRTVTSSSILSGGLARRIVLLVALLLAIGLTSSHQQLDLSTLHLLLEEPEFGLLAEVECRINSFVCLLNLIAATLIENLQRVEPISDLIVVAAVVRQPAQLLQQPVALLLRAPADILQRLELHQKLRVFVVGQLQLILRLDERVRLEHPLNLGRSDARLVEDLPRRRDGLIRGLRASECPTHADKHHTENRG